MSQKTIECDLKNERILTMLEGVINYVLSQEIDSEIHGSYFPSQSIDIFHPVFGYRSRLAWCYGDLGVAFALWKAGKILHKESLEMKALNILLSTTLRKDCNIERVIDSGICHGSAGLAMIYKHLYLETKTTAFHDAAVYWLNQTLLHSCFEDGLAGYKTYKIGQDWHCDYSLLTGIAGVGLVLLSFLETDDQKWSDLFLFS